MNTNSPFLNLDTGKNEADNYRQDYIFPEEGIEALRELGAVLLRIHKRLIEEGVIIEADTHHAQQDGSN